MTGNATILIVEDNDDLRGVLETWIGGNFPLCTVVSARTGEEACARARAVRPTVVLMDIRLPRENGIETTRCIKACVPDARIIILTMYEPSLYRDQAFDAGASMYIMKDRIYNELPKAVARCLPPGLEGGGSRRMYFQDGPPR